MQSQSEKHKAWQEKLHCATCRYADPQELEMGRPCCNLPGLAGELGTEGRCTKWRTLANDSGDGMQLVL
jgi:hypothetical protein